MTEPLIPELGALPWKPKRGTSLVHELNHWDIPTSGVLRSRWTRQHHLFRCLDGATTQYSVWAYMALSRKEARELMSLEGDALRQYQDRLMLSRTLAIAVAEEDAGIIHRARGRLAQSEPEPRLEPAVSRRVQREIQEEASALRDMPVFAAG
ncbi:hypothetical protein OH540_24200 [Streptomyces sp. BPPL-273]|uniref:hypothetical protein n=1 Tax=Streptomyces sp. BPPL-273 TaxID=2987533 RepID=UPI0024AFEB21|nr:hypothetical protein [Streptomyces sp. BPPL-273]WHM32974.1 hypothetical protein OH540_24200 [Streptomyces sp. BPPL-273]